MSTSQFAAPLGSPIFTGFDLSGNPVGGGRLETYVAGTATPKPTYPSYADALAGTAPNGNPVILDAAGRAQVWCQTPGLYKFVLKDSTGGTVHWTVDSYNPALATASPAITEWVPEPGTVVYVSATQFSISGVDRTSIYTVGRRVKATVTAGTVYGTVTATSFSTNTSVTIEPDSTGLDSGLSAVAYGFNAYTNPSYMDPRTSFTANKNGNQTGFAAGVKVANWTMVKDALTEWDNTNNRLVVRHSGDYNVTASVTLNDPGAAGQSLQVQVRKNGIASPVLLALYRTRAVSEDATVVASGLVPQMFANDYLEVFVVGNAGTIVGGTSIYTQFSVTRRP